MIKHLKGPFQSLSKKDLLACSKVLKKVLPNGLEKAIEHFKTLILKNTYIPYQKHLTGLSHHAGLGPSRRPVKCYKYVVSYLKNLRGALNNLKYTLEGVLINETTNKRNIGVIRCARGRRYRKDARNYNLFLQIQTLKS